MTIPAYGSISDVPPSGPFVNEDYSDEALSSLSTNITNSATAYQNAIDAYNTAYSPVSALQAVQTAYNVIKNNPSSTPEQIAAALAAYQYAYSLFDSTAQSQLATARENRFTTSTNYVTALAYQQIWVTQRSSENLLSQLSDLSSLKVLSAQQTAVLTAAQSDLRSAEIGLSTSFKDYRHEAYAAAANQIALDDAKMKLLVAKCALDLGSGTQSQVNAAQEAVNVLLEGQTTFDAAETKAHNALAAAITACETAYEGVRSLGSSVFPELVKIPISVEGTEIPYELIEAVQAAARESSITLASEQADIPNLTPAHRRMSLMELLNTLGKAHLMSLELIREAAASERQITMLRLLLEASHLIIYSNMLLGAGNDLLSQAINLYNSTVQQRNSEAYNEAAAAYAFYATTDARAAINTIIAKMNTAIAANEDRATRLASDISVINESIEQSVSATEASEPEAESYLSAYEEPPTPPAPTIPDVPPTTAFPLLGSLPDLNEETYTTQADEEALLNDINPKIEALLEKISPFKEEIIEGLASLKTQYEQENMISLDLDITKVAFYTQIKTAPSAAVSDTSMQNAALAIASFFNRMTATALTPNPQESESETAQYQFNLLDQLILRLTGYASSIGLTTAVPGAIPVALEKAFERLIQSSVFGTIIGEMLRRASMLAGLSTAASLPSLIEELKTKNTTLADILEAFGTQSSAALDAQTRRELANALIQQLSLLVQSPGVLRDNAVDIIAQGLTGPQALSPTDLANLISALITAQQLVLLTATVMIAVSEGLSLTELTGGFFTTSAVAPAGMTARFTAIGLSADQAFELAEAAIDSGISDEALARLGLDEKARTLLMGLILAAEGRSTIDQAMIDQWKTQLSEEYGVDLTQVDLTQPNAAAELVSQLIDQIAINASEAQKADLKSDILNEAITAGSRRGFQRAADDLRARILAAAASTTRQVVPSTLIKGLVEQFSAMDEASKQQFLDAAAKDETLSKMTGVPDEQKAAILAAIQSGAITTSEASIILALLSSEADAAAKGEALVLSNVQTALVKQLFTITPEERQRRDEELRREVNTRYTAPSKLPPQVVQTVRDAFEQFFLDITSPEKAKAAFEAFAETVKRLSDLYGVSVDFLLDPANTILRQFSLITRTGQDKVSQDKISLSG
jgi:hypothetical protein